MVAWSFDRTVARAGETQNRCDVGGTIAGVVGAKICTTPARQAAPTGGGRGPPQRRLLGPGMST